MAPHLVVPEGLYRPRLIITDKDHRGIDVQAGRHPLVHAEPEAARHHTLRQHLQHNGWTVISKQSCKAPVRIIRT